MESLVKLSFYCFAAASISLGLSALSYVAFAVGRVRIRSAAMATPEGQVFSTRSAERVSVPQGVARFGTMLAWFGVVFEGLALLFRTIVSERGPYANMYEFSLAFVFAAALIYLLFERNYEVKQLGAIVLPITFG